MSKELKPSERIEQITQTVLGDMMRRLPQELRDQFYPLSKEGWAGQIQSPVSDRILSSFLHMETRAKTEATIQYLDEENEKAEEFLRKMASKSEGELEGSGEASEGGAPTPAGSPPPIQPPLASDESAATRTEPEEPEHHQP